MIVVAGSLNMDLVGRVPRLPGWGETVLGDDLARHAGGKGGNQAVAAARLGARVAFAGAVGDDPFGDELRRGLQQEGIDTQALHARPASASGCALIHLGPGGDNAISVLPGANRLAPLPPQPWLADWRLLLLQLEIPLATTLAWAEAARAAGAQVLLNAAPMQALPSALLAAVDLLVVNEGELQALVGHPAEPAQALTEAAGRGPRRVVVTLGVRGGMAWDEGRLLSWPGHAVSVVDSTGAGDTFTGALAAALWQGRPFDEALRRANAAAALSCTQPGARGGMPRLAELEAWMAG